MSEQIRLSDAIQTSVLATRTRRRSPSRRLLAAATALALCAGAALAALNPVASLAATCGNESIRAQQGVAALALPECRAYELVSEPKGAPTVSESSTRPETQAAAGGGAIAFHSWYSPSNAASNGHAFVARRGTNGWLTSAIDPTLSPDKEGYIESATTWSSAELTAAIVGLEPTGNVPEPPVVVGEPTEGEYLLRRSGDPVSYQLVTPAPEVVPGADATFEGASQDFERIYFSEAAPLVSGAPEGEDLYLWNEGSLSMAAYSPGGTPIAAQMASGGQNAAELGYSTPMATHAVSTDGESIVFEAEGALYLRRHVGQPQSAIAAGSSKVNGEQCTEPAKACTVQLDAVQGGSGVSGGGKFWGASADGSHVFFSDTSELTANANTTSEKPDLYEYDAESGQLTDLTASAVEAAAVQGVVGVSEDGSYVYFVAEGVLTEVANARGQKAVKRKRNLYLSHDGTITFIATLYPGDAKDWGGKSEGVVSPSLTYRTAEATPDGQFLIFNSVYALTGYKNAPTGGGCSSTEGCNEIFLYDAAANELRCPSCGRPGSKPTGEADLEFPIGIDPRRQLMANGRVFFSTPSPLLAQDEDGTSDVYEWTPSGVAECEEGSPDYNVEAAGCQYLISSGTSAEPSFFADASESGEDVFFTTEQPLLASDTDSEMSLYDARVEGGFPGVPGVPVEPPACESRDTCGPAAKEPPIEAFGASTAFNGPGDLIPAKITEEETGAGGGKGKRPEGSRHQKLKHALKACAKKPKRKRRVCRANARRRFGSGRRGHGRRHAHSSQRNGERKGARR